MIWFFVNLIIVVIAGSVLFYSRMESRTRQVFAGPIEGVIRGIESDVNGVSRTERDDLLRKESEKYGVEFYLFDFTGKQLGGAEVQLPDEVYNEVSKPELWPANRPEPPPTGSSVPAPDPPPARPGAGGPPPSIYMTTSGEPRYWFVGRIMTFDTETKQPIRTRVIVGSNSYTGRGLFLNVTPFLLLGLGIFGFSLVFWFPFVRGMTGALSQMKKATREIANEKFTIRVDESRTDEIGELGESINQMASRLDGFVSGQKRFLGDISHELNSPLARMQFALSILEGNARDEDQPHIGDVKEEVELMSKLVQELLSYSKTGIQGSAVKLEPLNLRDLVEKVVEREATGTTKIDVDIGAGLRGEGQPELVHRALANVIRNSLVYSGKNGRITITSENGGNSVVLKIADNGPGVPENMLDKIFDPLFRVEDHRSRNTGGTGLGLAIVKTCIETCGGKVEARNLDPHGLETSITFLASKA
jgi:two-component system sensor histidine kinase CpxA